jgi:hypothetical protein
MKLGSANLGSANPDSEKLAYHFLIGLYLLSALLPVTTVRADDFTFSQAWQLLQKNNDGLAASEANKEEAVLAKQVLETRENAEKGLYKHLDYAKSWSSRGRLPEWSD